MQALTVHKGHPDLKLMDVEAVDFGSTVEVVDQTKGQKFKQGLKQFLVQNAVLILEKDLLALEPKKDADVIKQLKNYIQKTRNKGKVTYGYISKKIGDHDLDALMISLYGFKKMYSSVLGGAFEVARLRYGHQRTGLAEGQSTNDATALNSLTGICFGGKKQNIATTRKPMLSFSKRMNRSSIPIRNY
jgi:hypothetical protein